MLAGEVECDEAYVIAGHKEQPDAVKKGTHWTSSPSQNKTRMRDISQRETTNFWQDSTWG
jgi:hypothetical protein